MADIPSIGRRLHFVLALPGTGKTSAIGEIRKQGYNALDTDECRVTALKPVLKELRRAELWDHHNQLWHTMIGGGIQAALALGGARVERATKRLLVLDHTGWVIKSLQLWREVHAITVVHAPLDVLARRVAKREHWAYDEAYSLVSSAEKARESFLRYVPRDFRVNAVLLTAFNEDPAGALSLIPDWQASSIKEVSNG